MNRIRLFFATALAVAVLGVGLISSPAFAVSYFPPVTAFEDDDLDFLVKGATNTQAGIIEAGDRLVGVVEYNQTFGVFGGGPDPIGGGQELTGVFDITVVSKVKDGFLDFDKDGIQDVGEPDTFRFVFGPTGATGNLGGRPAGTMATLWLDGSPDLTVVPPNCANLAACIALANDGAIFLDLGFNGDVNQSWEAINAPDSTAVVQGGAAAAKFGSFNFFLNVLTNGTGQNIVPQLCVTSGCPGGGDGSVGLIGSGDILGGQGLTNGAFSRSDTDFQIATAAVPEPSTLLLLGSGLLGMNFLSRRRKK